MSSASPAPWAGWKRLDDEIQKAGGSATLVPLNLQRLRRHRPAGRLDLSSAGAGWTPCSAMPACWAQLTPLAHLEPKIFQEVMDVNVTANWRLIRSLDPLLRQSDAGRALFVTSRRGAQAHAFLGRLCRQQGGAGNPGADLCGGMRDAPTSRSICSIPARCAPRCARRRCRAKTRILCRAGRHGLEIVEMLSPADRNETIINFQKCIACRRARERSSGHGETVRSPLSFTRALP